MLTARCAPLDDLQLVQWQLQQRRVCHGNFSSNHVAHIANSQNAFKYFAGVQLHVRRQVAVLRPHHRTPCLLPGGQRLFFIYSYQRKQSPEYRAALSLSII